MDIPARLHERLRLRFINGFQRHVIAVKIENHEVRVMALDGQPAEPFLARNGAVVLAPGGRADVFVDATPGAGRNSPRSCCTTATRGPADRPAGRRQTTSGPRRGAASGRRPCRPTACRPDSTSKARCGSTSRSAATATRLGRACGLRGIDAPAFRAKAGRTVVLALTNRADKASVFHLHGHHFRLLDRLDDGWKPFWLDTLAIEPGQTQRIAFAAEIAGRWLMEATAADWAAPRLLRWFVVE